MQNECIHGLWICGCSSYSDVNLQCIIMLCTFEVLLLRSDRSALVHMSTCSIGNNTALLLNLPVTQSMTKSVAFILCKILMQAQAEEIPDKCCNPVFENTVFGEARRALRVCMLSQFWNKQEVIWGQLKEIVWETPCGFFSSQDQLTGAFCWFILPTASECCELEA